jgi:hypothetical protein
MSVCRMVSPFSHNFFLSFPLFWLWRKHGKARR